MKKIEKKHVGKVKTEFSTSSILKKNSTKIILKKNMWGNSEILQQNKNHMRKHYHNPLCFKKKNYKAKLTKTILEKIEENIS